MQHITQDTTQHIIHTERTQNAHNLHTHTEHNISHNPAQYRYNNTHKPQHRCITYDLHTYSFDLYHEQIYIKDSNTIELYTISKENI